VEGREGKGREGKKSAPLDLNPGDATATTLDVYGTTILYRSRPTSTRRAA